MPRLLCFFAHPDDETFGPGATLAKLADAGVSIDLVCATRGEAGTIGDSATHGPDKLAKIREAELVAACKILGINPPRILGLVDGMLMEQDPEELLLPMIGAIREFRPDALMTFEPGGVSGHADHRTVTSRCLAARIYAANAAYRPDLGNAHRVDRIWGYGIRDDITKRVEFRKTLGVEEEAIDAAIEVGAWIQRKRDAVAAHATQKPFIDRLEEELGDLDAAWAEEVFLCLATDSELPDRPVGDLFAGQDLG